MAKYSINAGKYRYKLDIMEQSGGLDTNGYPIPDGWQSVGLIYAQKLGLRGQEYFAAMAVQSEETVKFKTRFTNKITNANRLKLQVGASDYITYEIESVFDEYGQKKELTIYAKVIQDG